MRFWGVALGRKTGKAAELGYRIRRSPRYWLWLELPRSVGYDGPDIHEAIPQSGHEDGTPLSGMRPFRNLLLEMPDRIDPERPYLAVASHTLRTRRLQVRCVGKG